MSAAAYVPRSSAKPKKRWHGTTDDFLSGKPGASLGWFLINLESLSTAHEHGFETAYGFVRNDDLMERLDCKEDTIRRLWKQAEDRGDLVRDLTRTKDARGHVTGRIGFVWLKRPTDRPVATRETLDQAMAEMRAAIDRKKAAPRTVPFRPADSEMPRNSAGQRPAILLGNAPQFCDGPISKRPRGLEDEETEKTTTKPESSSSLASLSGDQELESPPVAIAPVLVLPPQTAADACNHAKVDDIPALTASVPELGTEAGIDQALLAILVTRLVAISAGFKAAPNWTREHARNAIVALVRLVGCPLWWIGKALDQAERRPKAKMGNKPVESFGFVRNTVLNWSKGDGSPGEPPGPKPPSVPTPRPLDQARNKSPAAVSQEQPVCKPEDSVPRLSLRDLMRQQDGYDPAALSRLDASNVERAKRNGVANGPG
jgi:hypothetical protein